MADVVKAPNKTTKSTFDLQVENADKVAKTAKGISFVIIKGNSVEYAHIPTTPDQKFKYFYNPSKLSNEERKSFEQRIMLQKILTPQKSVVEIADDLEP